MSFFHRKKKEPKVEAPAPETEPVVDHDELVRQADELLPQIENAEGSEKVRPARAPWRGPYVCRRG